MSADRDQCYHQASDFTFKEFIAPLLSELQANQDTRKTLVALGNVLMATDYEFVTVTPETHRRHQSNRARRSPNAESLRDVFGWGLPFELSLLPSELRSPVLQAGLVEDLANGLWKSKVRFSTLGERIFVHSAYPTLAPDAVFFGPDTYRFCDFLLRETPHVKRLVDVGCGTGAGGIVVADRCDELVLTDVSQLALSYASINAELAGVACSHVESDVLSSVEGPIDAVIANPPYLVDAEKRAYRDGGGRYGERLALRMIEEAIRRLEPSGTLLLYTGVAVVNGIDVLKEEATGLLKRAGATYRYSELDPDVFGEELDGAAYADVDRIAVIGLRATTSC